jgi:hypothetical protein
MGWRADVRRPNFCVRLWPVILLLAGLMALLASVQAQGEFVRGSPFRGPPGVAPIHHKAAARELYQELQHILNAATSTVL